MYATDNGRTSGVLLSPKNLITSGHWWRFDRYRIDGRGSIVPAEGAKLTRYSPWEEFRNLRKGGGRGSSIEQPAYTSLMQLVPKLRIRRGGRYPHCVSAGARQLILDWCQQH